MADQNNPISKLPAGVKDQVAFMSFIDDILKEKKETNLPEDQLIQLKTLLLKDLNEKVNTHLITLLSEKDQLELDDLLNKNVSDEELDNFFQSKIPNLVPEMTSVLLDFRADYLYTPLAKDSEKIIDKAIEENSKNPTNEPLMPSPAPVGK